MLPWFEDGKFPLYLAPMAGFTDIVFRELCKQQGADVMVTEFVLADGLVREKESMWETIDFSPEQRPMGVQIFGATPDSMAEAAKMIEERLRPDFIDLNFGCPASNITCLNAGSSLLRDVPLLADIASAVVKAVPNTPVTGKIRIGWDDENIVAVEVGKALEDVGTQAVAVHGRTKTQGYRGDARWEVIGEVADALQIPVIGNGSVRNAYDVERLRKNFGVSGLMIGRAALGYPWLFREIKHFLQTGKHLPPPGIEERWETIIQYTEGLMARPCKEKYQGKINWMRPRIKSLTTGMPQSASLRNKIDHIQYPQDLHQLAKEHMELCREPA